MAKDTQQQSFIRRDDVLRFITLAHIRCCFPLTKLLQSRTFTLYDLCAVVAAAVNKTLKQQTQNHSETKYLLYSVQMTPYCLA